VRVLSTAIGGGVSNPTAGWLLELERLGRQLSAAKNEIIHERPCHSPAERKQTVVGSGMPRDPIDRQSAMLLARPGDWLAYPPAPAQRFLPPERKQQRKRKGRKRTMEKLNAPLEHTTFGHETAIFGDYEIKGQRGPDGEMLFKVSDMNRVLLAMAKDLPEKTIPVLERAKDARAAVNELLDGLGADMTNFKDSCTKFLEDVRGTRMAVVAETSQMSKGLREVRQFFLGPDYKNEIERLREFVELCERLVALKRDGTLDALTDTIIKLA